jgi:dTDP-glucose 4,6-dehydratase
MVTGGLGFIGSNFIRYMLETDPNVKIVNVDNLSVGSNPVNLTGMSKDRRYGIEPSYGQKAAWGSVQHLRRK